MRIHGDVRKVSRVFGTFDERVGYSCQTPLAVVERIIRACSNPGDVVLDPMAGTGSACVAAAALGREFVGIEVCEQTAEKAQHRIAEAMQNPVAV